MPTWGRLLRELQELAERHAQQKPSIVPGPTPHDVLRRKYMRALAERTGRAVIVYYSAYLENKPGMAADAVSIGLGDQQGFMEAVANIKGRELDLFLHSPGGSAEAAESIVGYLRTRFDHIRAIVPLAAMSAATMMALACDEILMGAHSQLGPIDPQFTIFTPEGPRSAPAQAIIDQFEQAKLECQDPKNIAAWLPILRPYGPGLLAQCAHQRVLAEDFVTRYLAAHMFASDADAEEKARKAAAWFADFTSFRSHGRRVSREDARAQGIDVADLENDGELQDAVLSVHHAMQLTLSQTPAVKVIENDRGRAWINMIPQAQIQLALGPQQLQTPPTTPPATKSRPQGSGRR